MEAVFQSLMSGFPILILHLAATTTIAVVGVTIYVAITPYHEFKLIREGNTAAAISLSGAIVGIAVPLAFCMAASVSVIDILVWGSVTLALQLIAYKATDLLMRGLPERIEKNEIGPALVLVSIKLAVAAINAAAVSG